MVWGELCISKQGTPLVTAPSPMLHIWLTCEWPKPFPSVPWTCPLSPEPDDWFFCLLTLPYSSYRHKSILRLSVVRWYSMDSKVGRHAQDLGMAAAIIEHATLDATPPEVMLMRQTLFPYVWEHLHGRGFSFR